MDTDRSRILIAGSHTVRELDHRVKMWISHICDQGMLVLVGDHSGLDAALQAYLVDMHQDRVHVYTGRDRPRNNLDSWPVRKPSPTKARRNMNRFLQANLAMADAAGCGLLLWDGESAGCCMMMAELLRQEKPVRVYLPEEGVWYDLKDSTDLEDLLAAYLLPKDENLGIVET